MRIKFKLMFMFITLLLFSSHTLSSEYDWELVKNEQGITVYLQEYWADDIKSFKGVVQINSSLDSLLAVILDVPACADWVHHCIQPRLLVRKSFSECYHYQIHKLPFPAQNREFIFHSKIRHSIQTGAVMIQTKAVPNFCTSNSNLCSPAASTSLVRIKHSHGHYLLEPLDDGVTRVTWTHHTNPGGNLPGWFINHLIQEMPYRTLQGLRKIVLEDKYQKARMIVDSQGKIIDLVNTE